MKIRLRAFVFFFPLASTARKRFFSYAKPSDANRFERNEIRENGMSIYRQNPMLAQLRTREIFVFKGTTLFTEKKGAASPAANTGFFSIMSKKMPLYDPKSLNLPCLNTTYKSILTHSLKIVLLWSFFFYDTVIIIWYSTTYN